MFLSLVKGYGGGLGRTGWSIQILNKHTTAFGTDPPEHQKHV